MTRCQVIKANNRLCRNYARKGMTCCYSHRNLEDTEPEVETCDELTTHDQVPEEQIKIDYSDDKYKWPTLDEAKEAILLQQIHTYQDLVMFLKIHINQSENWPAFERKKLCLISTEFHFQLVQQGISFNKTLFNVVVSKLDQAGYDPIYTKFASQLIDL